MASPGTLIYLLAGVAVVAALWHQLPKPSVSECLVRLGLWPMFLVTSLVCRPARHPSPGAARAAEAEKNLLEAVRLLASRLGLSLSLEIARVRALGRAMQAAAERAVQLEAQLRDPCFDSEAIARELDRLRILRAREPLMQSVTARLGHAQRLRALWEQACADLDLAVARAEELRVHMTLLRMEAAPNAADAVARAREAAELLEELGAVFTSGEPRLPGEVGAHA